MEECSGEMSDRDVSKFKNRLLLLVGWQCFVTPATNSIKLHIDENKKVGTFLWMDPPWQFVKGEFVIESSDSCPHYREEGYEQKFRVWCDSFAPVQGRLIVEMDALPNGSLWIRLEGGHAFYLDAEVVPHDPDSSYDHWYLREEEVRANQEG